jgi:hypothetical protein
MRRGERCHPLPDQRRLLAQGLSGFFTSGESCGSRFKSCAVASKLWSSAEEKSESTRRSWADRGGYYRLRRSAADRGLSIHDPVPVGTSSPTRSKTLLAT